MQEKQEAPNSCTQLIDHLQVFIYNTEGWTNLRRLQKQKNQMNTKCQRKN